MSRMIDGVQYHVTCKHVAWSPREAACHIRSLSLLHSTYIIPLAVQFSPVGFNPVESSSVQSTSFHFSPDQSNRTCFTPAKKSNTAKK